MVDHADSELAIEIRGLTKSYDALQALQGVDLEVRRGEVFGFLGPNGAGKTTTIRCMLDLIRPSAGSIRVLGVDPQKDPVKVRAQVGYLPGELNLDDNLTSRGVLRLLDTLRGGGANWKFVEELARRLDLDMGRSIKNLSKGNKQKVGLIQAFMHHPPLLLLDEPTGGLDPLMQREVLRLTAEARDEGATVFFSSHILSEVQAATDRLAVVRRGRIVEIAPTQSFLQRSLRRVRLEFGTACPREVLAAVEGVKVLEESERLHYRLQVEGDLDPLLKAITDYRVKDIATEAASLEEVFLAYYSDEEHAAAQNDHRGPSTTT
ncbi:MAG: ABC transporter ATP-binding protein [Pirellulaceae bacterium]